MKLTLFPNDGTGYWDLLLDGLHLCSLESESMAITLRDRFNDAPKLSRYLRHAINASESKTPTQMDYDIVKRASKLISKDTLR